MDDRSYATDNGFYIGDEVEYYDGDSMVTSSIAEIIEKGKTTLIQVSVKKGKKETWEPMSVPCSIVKLENGAMVLDVRLTRI